MVRTRSNRYGLPQKMNLFRGKLTGHAKGFAFVTPEDNPEWMIFSFRQMKQAQRCMEMSSWYGYLRKHRAQGKKARSSEYLNAELHKWSVHTPKVKVLVSSSLMIKKIANDIFIPQHASHGAVEGHKGCRQAYFLS